MKNIYAVRNLVKEYIILKEHEYNSIISRINNPKEKNFKISLEKNTYSSYKDIHIILNYNYTGYNIREDKFYHTLNDNLIDIYHFTNGCEPSFDILEDKIKEHLKSYKVTKDMISLVLKLNKDNFYVMDNSLVFIYSYNQFGINSLSEFRIKVNLKDLYEHI